MMERLWSGSRDEAESSKCCSSGSESRSKLEGGLEMVEKAL